MSKHIREDRGEQAITWETLEGAVRGKVQEFIQAILEEEVNELLGREKWERRKAG